MDRDINNMFDDEDEVKAGTDTHHLEEFQENQGNEGNQEPQENQENETETAPVQDNEYEDYDENVYSIQSHKKTDGPQTKKKNVRRSKPQRESTEPQEIITPYEETPGDDYSNEDPLQRKRRLLEEKMTLAIKSKSTKRRKADEDDLERMQDDKIDYLKDKMIKAANTDAERNLQGQVATEKLKMLKEVTSVLSKADLAISILDNNLLEAVRLWLEPLPDASMPAYQIQKELINSLVDLPIKTDHLVASGIGKVMVFYQRSNRTEGSLKKIVDKLIGDWTRPILNKSDSYKDRSIQFQEYNKSRFTNKLSSSRPQVKKEAKTLYEESAERRNRAAIPAARTTAYKIAPKVNPDLLRRRFNNTGNDERFKKINQKLNFKKKATRKSGPSIEGRNLPM